MPPGLRVSVHNGDIKSIASELVACEGSKTYILLHDCTHRLSGDLEAITDGRQNEKHKTRV